MTAHSHPYISRLKALFSSGDVDRREFLRTSTLLGLSAAAAYVFADGKLVAPAAAAEMPKGGVLRLALRCNEIKSPHTADFVDKTNITRQVVEYLTVTGPDNITRPYLLEKWDASEDLKTWTLHLRRDVKWRDGRAFTADDVVWNLKRVTEPATGSSMLGLMKGYLVKDFPTGETDAKGKPKVTSKVWADNAIEKVDDHTVRLNAYAPQLAVPEHLYHYPMQILDPKENGVFGPGSNGTGPFELTAFTVGKSASLKARKGYWGTGPYLDGIEMVDLGDNQGTAIAAMASKQIDGMMLADQILINAMQKMPHVQVYSVVSAQTGVARGRMTDKPFNDKRVRQAMRLAMDRPKLLAAGIGGAGIVAEDHHVAPVHPEYAKLPPQVRDLVKARALLAEAGYPNGFDTEIVTRPSPAWELNSVQAIAEQLKEIGIRVAIKSLPSTQYWEVWDKVPFGFTAWAHRPLGVMTLSLAYKSGVAWNESAYSNSEFDRILTEAEGTYDVEKRRVLTAKLEAIMQDDGPILQPFWVYASTVMDKRVRGFAMHPSAYMHLQGVAIEPA